MVSRWQVSPATYAGASRPQQERFGGQQYIGGSPSGFVLSLDGKEAEQPRGRGAAEPTPARAAAQGRKAATSVYPVDIVPCCCCCCFLGTPPLPHHQAGFLSLPHRVVHPALWQGWREARYQHMEQISMA